MSDPHRAAFDHALGVLKPVDGNISQAGGSAFGFSIDIEYASGRISTARFGITGRFTCRIQAPLDQLGTGDEHLADIDSRLAHYRKTIIDWQTSSPTPFTFRDFNRLLAALSYNPESGTPESD
jgi:hypothetical protein